MIPGEYVLSSAPLVINAGREAVDVAVTNTGDRPVQVGSHYHFAEANSALQFDRAAAYGRRLDIPAGTAARFEPGDSRTVRLIELGAAGKCTASATPSTAHSARPDSMFPTHVSEGEGDAQ